MVGIVYLLIRRRRKGGGDDDRAEPAADNRAEPSSASAAGTGDAGQAVVLGLIQGPTELLPVSSSAHLTLVPWLAGWDWERLDPEVRKSFEVALHAGAAAALLIGQRRVIAAGAARVRPPPGGRDRAQLPAAGDRRLPLERQIEGRLGGPRATAIALLVGGAAMAIADRRPQLAAAARASAADGLALGVAQAAALAPGVSRNGATLAAARWRGFSREQANMLSRTVALPVIVGAAVLKAERLRRRGVAPSVRVALAAGVAASFASTLASQGLIRLVERDRALWPYAAYRAGLAGAVLARLRAPARRRPADRAADGRKAGGRVSDGTRRDLGSGMSDAYARPGSARARPTAPCRAGRRARQGRERARQVPLAGHYASVIRIDERTGIALSTDGVGTKLLVAEQLGRYDTVGIDCVAMNVNDVICVGAEPLAMLDYLAVENADAEREGQIGEGLRAGAELAGIEIPGGELAQLGELVRGFDLAGACFGLVQLDAIVTGAAIEPGDAVIGLPSSGLHSNGYTLARQAPRGARWGEDPGASAARSARRCSSRPRSTSSRCSSCCARASRSAGSPTSPRAGSATCCDSRPRSATRSTTRCRCRRCSSLIAERGEVSEAEMHEVFNMGCGFCCVVAAGDEARRRSSCFAPTTRRRSGSAEGRARLRARSDTARCGRDAVPK